MGRRWDVARRDLKAIADVDFSGGLTADEPVYRIALQHLLKLLRDQAERLPEAPQAPWARRKFKNDVFISYTHAEGEKQWVEQFHSDLQARLLMIRGERTTIFRDTESLSSSAPWSEMLVQNVRDSAIFIPVVTPRYLNSDLCSNELQQFVKGAEQSGGLSLQGRSRICPVLLGQIKSRVDLPYPLRNVQGIIFPEFRRGAATPDYRVAVEELARALSESLQLFQATPPKDAVPLEKTVYLAYATSDVETVREAVRRELQSRGYQVLPDGPDPHTEDDLTRMVKANMERSALSIHLIGDQYRSLSVLQLELAGECVNRGMSSLVWLRRGTLEDPNQRAWIASIEQGKYEAEILRTSVEQLKAHIVDKLRRREDLPRPRADGKLIYFQVDHSDVEAASPLVAYLTEQGFSVSLPVLEGPPEAIRDAHNQMLRACDATILYWGSVLDAWVRLRHADTLKLMLTQRHRLLMGVYIGPPANSIKERFAGFRNFLLLRSPSTGDPAALEPLIRQLRPDPHVS